MFLKLTGFTIKHLNSRAYSFHRKKTKTFTQLFRTVEAIPKENAGVESACRSFKLMLQNGLISSSSFGIYNILPLAMISLEKLSKLVEDLMEDIGAQKVLLPVLAHSSFWKASGRWDNPNNQLFKLKDRNSADYCLGPTHEEVITKMVSNFLPPLKHLPLKLFQISTKFRDEGNPKLGLLRGREFIMKDMYTFDTSVDEAMHTYSLVCDAYTKLFEKLDVECIKAEGSNAGMGGNLSHEYHLLAEVGEDEILFCPQCKTGMNTEVSSDSSVCSTCNSSLKKKKAIEAGHTFVLGTTYSETFEAKFKNAQGQLRVLEMGCYGLGLTRIIAASIECLSQSDKIRWPLLISPFLVSVILPKKGSKEESTNIFCNFLLDSLNTIDMLAGNIIVDDRTNFTIGKRVQDADTLGIPYSIVVGKTLLEDKPKFEVIDSYKKETMFLTHMELMMFFHQFGNTIAQKLDM